MTISLKQTFQTIAHKAHPDGLTIEGTLATCGRRSHALCILIFSLPFAQPIPLLGLSTPLGLVIALFGIFLALDRQIWLPSWLLRQHLNGKIVVRCCQVMIKILNRTEKLIRPRFGTWLFHPGTRALNGFLIVIFSGLLALPLPIPMSNIVPAYFLILNAFGWLEEDGVVILISYGVGVIGLIFFVALALGAKEILQLFT